MLETTSTLTEHLPLITMTAIPFIYKKITNKLQFVIDFNILQYYGYCRDMLIKG